MIGLIVVILCALFLVKFELLNGSGHSHLSTEEFFKLINAEYGPARILEKFQMEDGTFLYIVDMIGLDRIRILHLKSAPPQNRGMLPLTDQDMVNCKDRLVYFEERKFFELSRDCQANVLSLGLGGGQVNGFLHQNFPKMNITVVDISAQMLRMAKKWFDLQSDDHHRVILDDGARFVEEQAAKGVKYDAIILDACHSAPRTGIELMCPVKVFLQKRVIRSISQLLTDGGIIVMNAAAATIGSEDVRSMLRYHFHKFFNYCGHRKSAGFNQVFYCMHRRPSKNKQINLLAFVGETLS
ncbi:hypothetical protein RB195_008541 [Necator americanus]|uniref:Methyltransferase domain protein n=1 Tax=Necator americanus TaxID=51031 RepID=A0ABR1CRR9_NECAM